MAIENECVTKEGIFKALVDSATEYYKIIITVNSAFLGGSLLFVEKLSDKVAPTRNLMILLGLGWMLLVTSIILIVLVQRSNLKSGKLTMDGKAVEARKVDIHTGAESTWALITLAIGIGLIMLYGFVTLLKIVQ